MANRDYFDAYGINPDDLSPEQADAFGALINDLQSAQSRYSLKVSDKGAISIYGLGRFPMSIYADKLAVILEMADRIKRFVRANRDQIEARTGRAVPASLLR